MKKYLSLLLFVLCTNRLLSQTGYPKFNDRKPFSFEVTAGYNYFFTKGFILLNRSTSSNPVPISPYHGFATGVMLNAQLQTADDYNFDISFGLSYGRTEYKQQQKTTDRGIDVNISSVYSFLRPEIVARFLFFQNKKVVPYVSPGFGFNFSLSRNPVINAEYFFNDPYGFDRNQTFKLRSVYMNPKVAAGVVYKRSRVELTYAIPNDLSDNARFKLQTGYIGFNYYYRVTKR
ncbi:MAG: hypothetical protein K2Q24_12520 [Chitinophagaceae bacterium]|nr:hypothetical protein [Chitinophagaceae bacterium]